MTSDIDDPAGDRLFQAGGYTAWSRALHRLKPLPADARVLFESTISEPAALLGDTVARAFADGPPPQFESVFGGGNPELIASIAARYAVAPEQVVCATGASAALAMVVRALAPKGGHVLIEQPHLDLLAHIPRVLGAEVTAVERSEDCGSIDLEALASALRPDTKLIILTNPHNPSGAFLNESALAKLAMTAEAHGVPVLVDEVYWDFVRDTGAPIAAQIAPSFISVNSLTKVYGLFSLRCGWIVAQPEVARRIETANAGVEFGVSKLAHAVAARVFDELDAYEAHWREVLQTTRPILDARVAAMQADELIDRDPPTHGCMYFPRIVGCADTRSFAQRLWTERKLLVAHGEFFGRGGHIRLGFGDDGAQLDDGLARLHEALRAERDAAARRGADDRRAAARA